MHLPKQNKKTTLVVITITLMMQVGLCSQVVAKNLGTIGQLYPIHEPDFLEFIQSKARNLPLETLQSAMQSRATLYRDRPTPVMSISPASETKSWVVDPSIVLDHDITTPDGKILAQQGTRVNPLEHIKLTKTLIFYDADNKEEREWVSKLDKTFKGRDKLILVKGSVLIEEKRFAKPVYFDQAGHLSKRFAIEHVPATVVQEGHSLRITEVKI